MITGPRTFVGCIVELDEIVSNRLLLVPYYGKHGIDVGQDVTQLHVDVGNGGNVSRCQDKTIHDESNHEERKKQVSSETIHTTTMMGMNTTKSKSNTVRAHQGTS